MNIKEDEDEKYEKSMGLLMAAAMAVSLTACGGGTGSAGGTEGTKSAGQEAETDSGSGIG